MTELTTLSGQPISSIALGTWVFGADNWGGSKKLDCIGAVGASLEAGINFIDTAPIYGSGRSEEVVGEAIVNKRDQFFVATKCGLSKEGKQVHTDLSPAAIYKEVDCSLKRLKIDVIDLYQCHHPDPNVPVEQTMDAMRSLLDQQKIRYIGVSNFNKDLLEKASACAPVVTNQMSYSLLDRSHETELFPYCREKGIGILGYGPLGGGILTGKYEEPPTLEKSDVRNFFYQFYQGKRFADIQKNIEQLKKLDYPLAQVAINWVRQQPGVTSVLVGARNKKQIEQNAGALNCCLTQEQMEIINKLKW